MKKLKVLFCISILWFSASVLHPVPVDAELGSPSTGNWETVFEQAFSLNSFDQWQNFISENYIQMRTLWEEKMDAEISSIVSPVTESDVVHSTDVYRDYILKYLQAQKDSLLRDWEADSEQQISEERNMFLGKLSGDYVSRSDASIPGAGQDYFSQLQIWGTNFQDTLNLGLSEFQNGLAKIEQSYSELLEKLQKTDEEIAENEYKIRAYEGMVWDNVKGLVGNMAAQLISNTLLHEKDAQGNSLVTLRKSLSTADENISELLSMDKIAINNNYSQKFICTDMNSLDSCTAKITIDGGICQGPSEKTVKITEIESTVRPNYDDGVSRVFQSSEITGPTVTGWSGGTDILGNGIGTPVQSERNYILHYNTYQTYRDRLNGPGELMYEFISKMYSELKKPPEERSLTAAAEAVNLYLAEQKKETDKMAAFWESKIYTDINLGTDSTYRFVYNTFKEADYFRHSFVKDIEILYRLQENLRKLDVFSSGSVTLAYGFSEQNMDAVRGNMPGIYDSSIQPLYADSVKMPYLRANNLKTYSFAEKDTAVLENSMELSSVMERIKSSLKMIHPADNIEIDYIDPQMNLHASSVNLFSDWYVAGHDKVGGNLRTDGLNYRRYRTNFLIDGFAEAGGFDYRQDSEENIWVEIKYRIRDKNAEANWIQWANFQTDVNSQTVLWGSQLNAVQNWTVQSANFRNRASLWNQEKQSLQNEIQNNYNKSMEDLMNEKSAWLADMDSVRSKAVSGDFSADVPSVPLLSYENRISTIRDKTAGFENMQTPDFSSFEKFSSVLDDTMNGFLNLLTAKSITDSALSTSSSALNSMAAMLSSQRTMTDAYEVPPENRKEYYDAVKNFSAGGICAGDGFEKNRQTCEGIYNGPFFKRQYAGVEVRDGQIEVTVMEKTGRVFLKEGGDAKDQDDYIQETVKKTYYINTPGEAKIADMSSLGSVFKGSWSSKTEGWQNTERKEFGSDLAKYWQYWTDKPQQNLEETAETGSVQEQKKTLLSSVYDEVSKNSSIYLNHFYTNTGTAEKPVYSYNKEGLFSKMAALMSSRESENSQHFSNLARDNAKQEASKAEMLESLATAVVTGGLSQRNLSSWLKDRMTQAVKGKWAQTAADAMCPGDSAKAKEPCQASEIAMALLNAKVDKDTRKKAEKQAFRNAFSAGSIISPAFGEMLNSVRDIPVLKEIVKPTVSLVSNLNAEAAYGVGRVVENIIPEGRLVFGNEYKNWQNHIQRSANAAADSFKSRDLQRDLNAGKTDYRNEVKGMIKEELFKYFANLISPSFPGIRNNDIIKFLKYDQNRRDSAEKERSAERRRQEIAAQTAAAAVLTFVPGAQGAAGAVFSGIVSALESVPVLGNLVTGMKWIIQGAAEYMAEAGSYLQSSIGIAASESAGAGAAGTAANSLTAQALQNYSSASILTSGLSAAADGNSEGVIAAAVNGLLLSFTGPAGGFAGHVSYTPPEKTDLLTGLLNKIDGAPKPTSGWGGGFNFGGSIFNAGLTFTPGSGTSVDLGFSNGGQWNQSMFGNISYNINSGHTNGSIGLGQEYGTNLSANFSTVEAPSYTLSFGCDMQGDKGKTGTNCGGGGANKYGLGGSLTLTENGIDAGIDLLGNSFANSSYDRESGTWSDPEFDESWAYNVQQMSSQDLADEEINASARKTVFDEHYKKLLENDPSIAERLQAFLDGRKPGEDEYTALQSFYQDNRELAAQNGFNLPSDNKSSDSSIADAVYNASQIFLGALGISTLGLGLLNRTGAGTGGSPSPDPRSPIPETGVRPNRREEGDGGETGGEGPNDGNAEKPEGGGYDDSETYFNDDPYKGLTADEFAEKNSLQEKYDSGTASEEDMERLSFLSTIDNIARYGNTLAQEGNETLPTRNIEDEIEDIRSAETERLESSSVSSAVHTENPVTQSRSGDIEKTRQKITDSILKNTGESVSQIISKFEGSAAEKSELLRSAKTALFKLADGNVSPETAVKRLNEFAKHDFYKEIAGELRDKVREIKAEQIKKAGEYYSGNIESLKNTFLKNTKFESFMNELASVSFHKGEKAGLTMLEKFSGTPEEKAKMKEIFESFIKPVSNFGEPPMKKALQEQFKLKKQETAAGSMTDVLGKFADVLKNVKLSSLWPQILTGKENVSILTKGELPEGFDPINKKFTEGSLFDVLEHKLNKKINSDAYIQKLLSSGKISIEQAKKLSNDLEKTEYKGMTAKQFNSQKKEILMNLRLGFFDGFDSPLNAKIVKEMKTTGSKYTTVVDGQTVYDSPGTVSIIEGNFMNQSNFWKDYVGDFSNSLHYGNPDSPNKADISGLNKFTDKEKLWYGPNSNFRIDDFSLNTPIGGTSVTLTTLSKNGVETGKFTLFHMDTFNSAILETGKVFSPGTFLGATKKKIGLSTGAHLHIENLTSSRLETVNIFRGQ